MIIFAIPAIVCWVLFRISFARDRSRYRNCYLLFICLLSLIPCLLSIPGPLTKPIFVIVCDAILIGLLVVPFFLIHNGIVMIKREGRSIKIFFH